MSYVMNLFSKVRSSSSRKVTKEAWQVANIERRIMLDGDGAATADATVPAEVVPLTVEAAEANAVTTNLVFIDAEVGDIRTLTDGVADNAEIILLDAETDGITQITNELAKRRNVTSVHLVTHGESGQVRFAANQLNTENMSQYEGQLRAWSRSLTQDADILLYGCNISDGVAGQQLISRLAGITGADVAASSDKTGSQDNAADWQLEDTIGSVEHSIAFSALAQQQFGDVLIVVDFESATPGPQGPVYTEAGFQFSDGGWNSFDLQVYDNTQGYASNVLHPLHYSRTVTIERTDGESFFLDSFDYAAGRVGTTDATVTGFLSDGTTVSSSFDSDTKSLETLDLSWNSLTSVVIDFRGGANDKFGALDNFDFGSGPSESTISLADSTVTVGEGDAFANFTLTRTGNTQDAVSVDYATVNGSATSGSDFAAESGTVSFAAGQTTATVQVAITDDAASESNETFSLALSNASAGATIGTASSVATIIDNDSTTTGATIDFEELSVGLQGTSIVSQGFTFEDIGVGTSPLRVYGSSDGYTDNVLHSNNWNRAIRMSSVDDTAFDLISLDYGAGRWNTLTDATVTANFSDGTTAVQELSTSTKSLSTLALNWSGLLSVEIDFSGGATNAYGAVDNFAVGNDVVAADPITFIAIDRSTNASASYNGFIPPDTNVSDSAQEAAETDQVGDFDGTITARIFDGDLRASSFHVSELDTFGGDVVFDLFATETFTGQAFPPFGSASASSNYTVQFVANDDVLFAADGFLSANLSPGGFPLGSSRMSLKQNTAEGEVTVFQYFVTPDSDVSGNDFVEPVSEAVQLTAGETYTLEIYGSASAQQQNNAEAAGEIQWSVTPAATNPTTVFYDGFEAPSTWTLNPDGTDTATSATWENAVSEPTTTQFGTPVQLAPTAGTQSLVTGGLAGTDTESFDLEGTTSILSTPIDLPTLEDGTLFLSFDSNFAQIGPNNSNNYLRVSIVAGGEAEQVFEQGGGFSPGEWKTSGVVLNEYAGQTIQLLIEASGYTASFTTAEAQLDEMYIRIV